MTKYTFEAMNENSTIFSDSTYCFPGFSSANLARVFYKIANRFARIQGKEITLIRINGKFYF